MGFIDGRRTRRRLSHTGVRNELAVLITGHLFIILKINRRKYVYCEPSLELE